MLTVQDFWDQLLANTAFCAEAPVGGLRDACHDLLWAIFPLASPHFAQPATAAGFYGMAQQTLRGAIDSGAAHAFAMAVAAHHGVPARMARMMTRRYRQQLEDMHVELVERRRLTEAARNPNADPNDAALGRLAATDWEDGVAQILTGTALMQFQAGQQSLGTLMYELAARMQ